MYKWIFIVISVIMTDASIFGQDWPNLGKYEKANEILMNEKIPSGRVVFMGNSITEEWKRYDKTLFNEDLMVNRGIGGQTTPQMLIRFRPDVIDLKPEIVVIMAGINDIAGNTGPSSLEMIMDNLKSMTEIALQNDIKVILCSVLPALDFPWKAGMEPAPKVVRLNRMIQAYANDVSVTYVDYFSKMADERNGMRKGLAYDEVHPTKEGYDIMRPIILSVVKKVRKE